MLFDSDCCVYSTTRLLSSAHTPPHHGNIQTHSSSLNIIFVLAIARDERKQSENEISTACHNIIALFSKYWFHHSTFFAKKHNEIYRQSLVRVVFFWLFVHRKPSEEFIELKSLLLTFNEFLEWIFV